ncbi:MAG: glycosyltransferase [Bacteroidaceae bacterium]|nr:glycosyltransferase [Bacteroidaceae bacterium]
MTICFVSYRTNNPYIGGIENVTYSLCKEFTKRGYNVICISQLDDKSQDYTPLCTELRFPNKKNIYNKDNLYFLEKVIKENNIDIIINQYSINTGFSKLCHKIKEVFPYVMLITPLHFDLRHQLKAIENNCFIKIKNGTDIIMWAKGLLLFCKYHLYKKHIILKQIKEHIEYIVETSDFVIPLTDNAKKDVINIYGGLNNHKFVTIGNPIDIISRENNTKKKHIIYVGRIEYGLKRTDRIIDIWQKLEKKNPDWNLFIVGDGPLRRHFEDIAHAKGLKRIYFEGFKDPAEYYQEALILCLTSSSEGFAKVIIEAQSYSCVPVAFNSFPALNDLITDGINGYKIRPFDKNEFVTKLQNLMNDPNKCQIIGNNGRIQSEKFALSAIVDKWENLFNQNFSK